MATAVPENQTATRACVAVILKYRSMQCSVQTGHHSRPIGSVSHSTASIDSTGTFAMKHSSLVADRERSGRRCCSVTGSLGGAGRRILVGSRLHQHLESGYSPASYPLARCGTPCSGCCGVEPPARRDSSFAIRDKGSGWRMTHSPSQNLASQH